MASFTRLTALFVLFLGVMAFANQRPTGATGTFALIGSPIYQLDVQCSQPPYAPQCAQIVEQQTSTGVKGTGDWPGDPTLWVINPYSDRAWSADDSISFDAIGTLDPGQTFSQTLNFIADWQLHLFNLNGIAEKNASFTITISDPSHNRSVTASSAVVGRNTQAIVGMCGIQYGHTSPPDPRLQSISGSNGGIGLPYPVTYSITNTGTRAIKSGSMSGKIQVFFSWADCNAVWNGL